MSKDRPTAEDRIIEILEKHEVFEVDIPDELQRDTAIKEIATAIQHESGAQERYDKVIKMFNDRKSERPHPAVVRRWIELASGLPDGHIIKVKHPKHPFKG